MQVSYTLDGGYTWIETSNDNVQYPYSYNIKYIDYSFSIDTSSIPEGSVVFLKFRVCSNYNDWSDYAVSNQIVMKVYTEPTFYHLYDNIKGAYPKKQDGSIDLPNTYNSADGKYHVGTMPLSIWKDFMANVQNLYKYVMAEYVDGIDPICQEFQSINFNLPNAGDQMTLPICLNTVAILFKCCLTLFINKQLPYTATPDYSYYIKTSDGGFSVYDPSDPGYQYDVYGSVSNNFGVYYYNHDSSGKYSIGYSNNFYYVYQCIKEMDRLYNMCINFMNMLSYSDYSTRFSDADINNIRNNTVSITPNKSYYIIRN
jgi:hypothetical protein